MGVLPVRLLLSVLVGIPRVYIGIDGLSVSSTLALFGFLLECHELFEGAGCIVYFVLCSSGRSIGLDFLPFIVVLVLGIGFGRGFRLICR